jgi:hypothetical protein
VYEGAWIGLKLGSISLRLITIGSLLNPKNVSLKRCPFLINILSWFFPLHGDYHMSWWQDLSLQILALTQNQILVAREFTSLSVCGSLRLHKPQSGPLLMLECGISVFHWDIVSMKVIVYSLKFMIIPNYPSRSLPWTLIKSYVFDEPEGESTWNSEEDFFSWHWILGVKIS